MVDLRMVILFTSTMAVTSSNFSISILAVNTTPTPTTTAVTSATSTTPTTIAVTLATFTTPTTTTVTSATSTIPTTTTVTLATSTTPTTTTTVTSATSTTPTTTTVTTTPSTTPTTTTRVPAMTTAAVTSPTSTTSLQCQNGGSLVNGLCFCPDAYTGVWCHIQNFCSMKIIGQNTFPLTMSGLYSYSKEQCTSGTPNAGFPQASVLCLNQSFGNPILLNCSQTLDTINVDISLNSPETKKLAFNTQIITSKTAQLTAYNISTAAQITSKLLSQDEIPEEIKQSAVIITSQLLDANQKQFSDSTEISTTRLVQALQNFSLKNCKNSIVQPNLVVQSVTVKSAESVHLTAFKNQSGSDKFSPNRINLTTAASDVQIPTDVQITISFKTDEPQSNSDVDLGFVLYNNDYFFRARNFEASMDTQRKVMFANVLKSSTIDSIMFNVSKENISGFHLRDFACVKWDFNTQTWSGQGCEKVLHNGLGRSTVVTCNCKKIANFAVLMSFGQNFDYSPALGMISIIGCVLSIVGLVLTALFQVLTRTSRQTTPTVLMISICVCMTISYLLFIFGINNPVQQNSTSVPLNTNAVPTTDFHQEPDSGPCTVFTALLQYFLLASFSWSTLFAVHIFFLLRNSISGLPAVMVGITLGITYRIERPLGYRQEEFCWLAGMDVNGRPDMQKPMLWGFLLPVAIMLLINIVTVTHFSRNTCRPNPELNSSRVTSLRQKMQSIFSLTVVLGVTWLFGYFMLITTDPILHNILTYVFCLCNTTQGIQMFFLFTVRTPFFKQKFSALLKSVPPPVMAFHRETYHLWRVGPNDPPERYTSMDFDLSEQPATNGLTGILGGVP